MAGEGSNKWPERDQENVSAWLGSGSLGLGSAQAISARLASSRLGLARPSPARLTSVCLSSSWAGSARFLVSRAIPRFLRVENVFF